MPALLLVLDWARADSCSELGFNKPACSSCSKLGDTAQGAESATTEEMDKLVKECEACCEKDVVEDALVRYAFAKLKVCG